MSNMKVLTDNMAHHDALSMGLQNKPYTRTKIIAGYDAYKDKTGVTRFGEVAFETENMIVLGGAQFTLEKVFGVHSGLDVAYLHEIDKSFPQPTDGVDPVDNTVCLFGVGIGGAGESITDVKDVKYYERTITDMIPIRQTADELTADEKGKYWGRKTVNIGDDVKTAYYLKAFESAPEIRVLWKDAEGDEDGAEVGDNVHETSSTTPIETFIEITLKLSKKDVREFFADNGEIEQSRINSIGLFTGVKRNFGSFEDYTYCKLFSKLNINNEMLSLSKDLTIVYRIYTS